MHLDKRGNLSYTLVKIYPEHGRLPGLDVRCDCHLCLLGKLCAHLRKD